MLLRALGACVCLGLLLRCTPDPDPGQLGGVCVDGNLCDFGLACTGGICRGGEEPSGGALDSDGGVAAGSGSGGTGGANSGTGGSEISAGGGGVNMGGRGGTNGGGAGPGGAGGSEGGAGGVEPADAGIGGSTGGAGSSCVGLPAVRGRCNRNACLCPETDECYPVASATACCAVAPVCN